MRRRRKRFFWWVVIVCAIIGLYFSEIGRKTVPAAYRNRKIDDRVVNGYRGVVNRFPSEQIAFWYRDTKKKIELEHPAVRKLLQPAPVDLKPDRSRSGAFGIVVGAFRSLRNFSLTLYRIFTLCFLEHHPSRRR